MEKNRQKETTMTQEDKKIEVQLTFNIIVTPITWHAQDLYVAELPEYAIPVAIGDTKDAVASAVMAILSDAGEREPLRYPIDEESLSLRLARYSNSESVVIRHTKPIKVDKSLLSMTEESAKLLARNIVLLDGGVDITLDELKVTRYFACYGVSREDKQPLYDEYTCLYIFGDEFQAVANGGFYRDKSSYYDGEGFVDRLIRQIMRSKHVQGSDIPTWAFELAKTYIRERRKKLLGQLADIPDPDMNLDMDIMKFLRGCAHTFSEAMNDEKQPEGEDDE